MSSPPTPMFPLGVVHFPHVMLPLRVFEPRYRELTLACLDTDRRFGVVLIERGSEVGGGDSRFDVGTLTEIVDAAVDPAGIIHIDTVGVGRVRVDRWLPDDPYPQAETTRLPDPVLGVAEVAALTSVERKVRRALAMTAELGESAAPFTTTLDEAPARALFQLAAIAPLGPVDHQRLLAADGAADLLAQLDVLMEDHLSVLASRLSGH